MEGTRRSRQGARAGQFSARALIHNLRDRDYGRSLADIRSAFYSAPRLPLLFGGDDDLQRAIFDAAAQDLVRIIDGNDNPVAVTNPNQVNLTSAGLRLAKPAATQDVPEDDNDDQSHNSRSDEDSQDRREGGTSAQLSTPPKPTDQNGTEPPAEKRVVVSFTRNLLNQDEAADQFAALFRHLYLAADERQISYIQGTLQLVLDAKTVPDIERIATDLGLNPSVRDQ